MDIRQLTDEMNRFVKSKGWYETESSRPQTARNLAISLALEAAEVLEHYQWGDAADSKDDLRAELADVALYLLQLASVTGIDLEEAVLEKLKKNYSRQWDVKDNIQEDKS
jgi:NTP pyrophosphatase (non-canonical NTP hydrolase)